MAEKPGLSLEFFPPKTLEARQRLASTAEDLRAVRPDYVSVTYGAGGSTREGSLETVRQMRGLFPSVAPHISCIGATAAQMRELLDLYAELKISRLVALRGDLPSGYGQGGEFQHASDLVRFIRSQAQSSFHVEVAAYPEIHPQAKSAEDDLRFFVEKIRAGADGAITQYFSIRMRISDLLMMCMRSASMCPSFPGSCRSPTSLSLRDSRMPVGQRSRVGFVNGWPGLAMTRRPSRHSARP